MADIFLSYKREDRARAGQIVAALREAGWSVWWDEGLTPRQAWDATIEQEIAAAKSVVVLWSPRSVASDWVRTEAHYAQERAKLIPVVIEPCAVPLAFILKQAVDLSHWRGARDDPAWLKLAEWLQAQAPASEPKPSSPSRASRLPGWMGGRAIAAIAAVAVLLVAVTAGALLFLRPHGGGGGGASIRVAPFEAPAGDKAAAAFSQGFAADLAQIVTAGGSKLKVFDGTGSAGATATHAEYTLGGAVRSDATDLSATLTLNTAADGTIIWSTSLKRPLAQAEAMHHEAEVRMGAVFVCALDEAARNRAIVSLEALKVYLQACEGLPSGEMRETRQKLRDLVQLAPGFAQGWALLAQWNGFVAGQGGDDASAAAKEALTAAARALAIDPRNGSAWVARAMVKTPIPEWQAAQADLDRALALSPNEPIGNFFYASGLINVGRTNEALDYAQRAAASGPLFEPKTRQVIQTLAGSGDIYKAQEELATARGTWPGRSSLLNLATTLAAQYEDPTDAAATFDDPEIKAATPPERLQMLRFEAAARADPSPVHVEAAARLIAKALASPDAAWAALGHYLVIGRVDDAYAALDRATTALLNAPYAYNPSPFFKPFAAKFRADPRFMPMAAKLGLVAVWQATKWPDFCTAKNAPYDCRAAAAKATIRPVGPHAQAPAGLDRLS